MLKTNSKQARENIRAYIMNHFNPADYDVNQEPETFREVAEIIWTTFESEKHYSIESILYHGIPYKSVFTDWCQGLPSILDTCYYYNRSAVADLGKILEGLDDVQNRYDESDAENLLTSLIYREIRKEIQK